MEPGDVIAGKYRLERPIGQGGAGMVWAATQLGLQRMVALKLLHPNDFGGHGRRFQREAQAVGRLDHPNCVRLFDYGTTDEGAPFLAFELLEGQSLDALRGVRLDWKRCARIGHEVASALAYAHSKGIIHRDLKPANIFQAVHRHRERIKVVDFGLAKVGDPNVDLTDTGDVFGTPLYMSPEQLRGSRAVSTATDLYALGVVLFELLEGRPPFQADSPIELAHLHLTAAPPAVQRPDCPDALRDLVAQLLSKEPEQRPTSEEVVARLGALTSPRTSNPTSLRGLAAAGVAMILLSVAVLVWVFTSPEPEPLPNVQRTSTRLTTPTTPARPADVRAEDTHDLSSADLESTPVELPSGCGRRIPARGIVDQSGAADYTILLPRSYDPDEPTPLVMFLPEAAQLPFDDTGLADVAEEHGFLLLVPVELAGDRRRASLGLWSYDGHFDNLLAAVHDTRSKYCVDEDRFFAVGHATGGEIVEKLGCADLGIDGIATTATRTTKLDAVCAVPYLHLAAKYDGYNPIEGGESCSGVTKISLQTQENHWRTLNGCEKRKRVMARGEGAVCWDWQGCERPFRSCLVEGGHNWPGTGERILGNLQELVKGQEDCDGPPTEFPIKRAIWRFFESLSD